MSDDLELSRDLTRVVRAVAGVQDVYTTGGVLATAAQAVAIAAGTSDDDTRVQVGRDTVVVSIAVASGFPAPETLRAVTAAVAAHLAAVDEDSRRISVRASRIE